ncbi:MAG: fibronectin type III domain-containing protein, partial [Polaromonas sp.]
MGINSRGQYSTSAVVSGSPVDDVPATPTGLTGLPGARLNEVYLTWNPSSEGDLAGYVIYREQGGNYVPLTPSPVQAAWFIDPNASAGATFTYAISAQDTQGHTSPLSSTVSVTSKLATPAPPNLEATSYALMSWDNSPFVGNALQWTGHGTNRVRVYRKDDLAPWSGYQAIYTSPSTVSISDYTDSSMDWCRAYTYVVRTIDSNGVESVDPNYSAYAERILRPNKPTITWSGNDAHLSWGDLVGCTPAGNGFTIEKWFILGPGISEEYDPNVTSHTYAGIANGLPDTFFYAFAIFARVKLTLAPPDPNLPTVFYTNISDDICAIRGTGDQGEMAPSVCNDISHNYVPPPPGGGSGLPPEPQQGPIRLIRPGP